MKGIRIRIFILSLFALFVEGRQEVFGLPADPLPLADKVNRVSSFATEFRGEVGLNPALYYYFTPFSWTSLDINGVYHDKGKAALRQEGDKETHIGVDVNSFVVLSEHSRVFGSAGYRNKKQENVGWNENLDWETVAPYVTGDSIGGFLKGEIYYFKGGYARESGDWTWGLSGGYKAAHNYRDKDPRPRNTSSDLTFACGAGYRFGKYRFGMAADFRLYQQQSEITFMADKGSTSVYHMLGLGKDYVRFAGTQTGVKYQGLQWGGQMALLPACSADGWSVQLGMNRMNLDKNLSGANNLTLLRLETTQLKGDVAWMQKMRKNAQAGLKLNASYLLRQGKEHIYGEAGGNSYGTLISISPGIRVAKTQVGLQGLWESSLTNQRHWGGAIVPEINCHWLDIDYKAASRQVCLSSLEVSLLGRLYYQKKKWRFTAEAKGSYNANLLAASLLPGLDTSKSSSQALLDNVAYLSDSYGMMGVLLQANYPVIKQSSLFLALQWQRVQYKKSGMTQYAACSLGLFF